MGTTARRMLFPAVALALHWPIAALLPAAHPRTEVASVQSMTVSVEVTVPSPPPREPEAQDPLRTPQPAAVERPPRGARRAPTKRLPAVVERAPVAPAQMPRPAPAKVAEPPVALAISPRDAARTVVSLDAMACDAGVPDAAASGAHEQDAAAAQAAWRAAMLTRDDGADAMPYALEPTDEGGFRYRDEVFVATIRPDGSVRFRDTLKTTSPLGLTKPRGFEDQGQEKRTRGVSLGLRLDRLVRDYVLKKPRNQARKRTFMEHTQALRDELADAFRKRLTERGAQLLRKRLDVLWSAPGPSEAKRRAIFDLWDGCADDAQGLVGKRVVEAFIRERLPREGGLGYTDGELEELNRIRRSEDPFAPYESQAPG